MAWQSCWCPGWPFPKFTCPEASLSLQPQESQPPQLVSQQDRPLESLSPSLTKLLLERSAAETVTKGGIMLPEKSPGEVLQATAVAAEWGSQGKGGAAQPVKEQTEDKLLPEYGAIKVVLDDGDCLLVGNGDILGKNEIISILHRSIN